MKSAVMCSRVRAYVCYCHSKARVEYHIVSFGQVWYQTAPPRTPSSGLLSLLAFCAESFGNGEAKQPTPSMSEGNSIM